MRAFTPDRDYLTVKRRTFTEVDVLFARHIERFDWEVMDMLHAETDNAAVLSTWDMVKDVLELGTAVIRAKHPYRAGIECLAKNWGAPEWVVKSAWRVAMDGVGNVV